VRARTLSILFVVFGLLLSTSCKKAADLAKYKDQAMALAGQYAPQLKDLSGKLDGLMAKAKSLPVSIPGVDKLTKLLEDNKGNLGKLQGLVDGIPAKAADAVKSGKKAEVEGLISTINSEVGGGITKITTDLATATTEMVELEKKAAEAAAATATGDFAKALPGGAEVKGAATGVEAQLIAFIEDATKAVDKTTWFDFDRLTFGTGGAALEMDKSKAQLDNIVAILKAYPNVRLKVGGYTDNTGKAEDNKKLSGERASAVVEALKAAGVEPKRLEAEGYGSEHPVCTDDTDECRAKNRRIAVRVSAK
jgi:outer membrane protein OmpA-like peptidoglycan-associated protein